MQTEIWKDIKGYEGLYKVSNLGRIKSLKRKVYDKTRHYYKIINERILKQTIATPKYYVVNLTKKGIQKTYRIHKIVAETFIPNPNNYIIINHIDGNKLNNNIDNLEWCTYKHNSQEAKRLGLLKSSMNSLKRWNGKYGKEHNRSKIIYQIDKNTDEIINMFYGIAEASRETGINKSNISACCNHKVKNKKGRRWVVRTAGGYKWEFKEKK